PVQGAHALAAGVERDLVHAREVVLKLVAHQARLGGGDDERAFSRVADHAHAVRIILVYLQPRVAGERGGGQKLAHIVDLVRADLFAVKIELADGRVALPGHLDLVAHHREANRRHLVLGERAGLVRADGRGAAERLDGGQAADERVALHHLAHAERQVNGDDGRQALGYGGDRQRDRRQEGRQRRFAKLRGQQRVLQCGAEL